jgi:ketosteroid isomerase-like protein
MKHRLGLAALLLLSMPGALWAHVGVRPRESRPSAEEQYSVRVPTEGDVATASVTLEIPAGVTVLDVSPVGGATFDTQKGADGRIARITWTKVIPPKEMAEFPFRARNPGSGTELVWKASQRFADGSVVEWAGPAGDRRPASVTKLVAGAGEAGQAAASAPIEAWLKGYDAAFNAKDLSQLARFYHPDVTIYEGGGINNGWADYRDKHLGPELAAFEQLEFGHSDLVVHLLGDGQTAYATSRYRLKAKMGERQVDSEGLETLVLLKQGDGTWRIRHAHTSSRPARRPSAD